MTDRTKCTKAIIAVAGYGTRRLPITKAIEKCLLPVGDRPIVDYIVESCIQAGITDIIFVVGEQSEQIRTYYGQNKQLEDYLQAHKKFEALEQVRHISQKANFHFVVQDRDQPYGTSTPVWLAKDYIEPGESFLFLYGDAIFFNPTGKSVVADFLAKAERADTRGAIMAVEVPLEEVSHYGIVDLENKNGLEIYKRIVEKPTPEEAPTNLNNAGCFLIPPDIFPYVEQSLLDSPQKEKYFIDALNWFSDAGNELAVIRMDGEFLDCGSAHGWLTANNRILGNLHN